MDFEGLKGGKCGLGVVVTAREAMHEAAEAKCGYGWRSLLPHKAFVNTIYMIFFVFMILDHLFYFC